MMLLFWGIGLIKKFELEVLVNFNKICSACNILYETHYKIESAGIKAMIKKYAGIVLRS